MKKYALILISGLLFTGLSAQDTAKIILSKKRGTIYGSWGYNRDWFSKSDIHFQNKSKDGNPVTKAADDSYDFTVYNATANDRPGFEGMLQKGPTIPQYNYRIGYYFNDENDLGIEINFDHAKYVMNDYQRLHVKGTIHGRYIDQDTTISPTDFLHFEHTNGANFLMLNILKRKQLCQTKNEKHMLAAVVKLGAGAVIPKTDVTMFGQRVDNRFHIAGYCIGLETGIRYEAFHHFFLEYTAKESFDNYTRVLVNGTEKAHHYFWTFENILTLGIQLGGGTK